MRAFILAAGLGTRLRPFTLEHPKALVPVGGVPMLERVMLRLRSEGFDSVVINVHHFAGQIEEFLRANENFGMDVAISDERAQLLDTGGALLHAMPLLIDRPDEPVLVHNVDILSDAPLREVWQSHRQSGAMATLIVSPRDSSRRLGFGSDGELHGWVNLADGATRPSGYDPLREADRLLAFSGIHVITPRAMLAEMERQGREGAFSVIDFYLKAIDVAKVKSYESEALRLIDIGKPATLAQAESFFDLH
ncbi:MAG: NTP transferase domain-containing protein [Muribaculaceae bacterium]|nr:NTP transferase domain-containing protein [Muribaculaceae bacterium]